MTTTPPTVQAEASTLIGDLETMWVHDSSNEKPSCGLEAAAARGNAVTFRPDTITRAHDDGFDDCPHCLGPDPIPIGENADH